MRDYKITSIYKDTNGIKVMDHLGRKLGLKKRKTFIDMLGKMSATIAAAKKIEALSSMTAKFEKNMGYLQ